MAEQSENPVLLKCSHCGKQSDSLKQFTIATGILCLFVHFSWKPVHYTACPSCMRKFIFAKMAINLIPANITWPIFVVASWGPQFARSFSHGHTRWIRKQIAEGKLAVDSTFA